MLECMGTKGKLFRLIGQAMKDDSVDVVGDDCGDPPLLKLEFDSTALSRRESFSKHMLSDSVGLISIPFGFKLTGCNRNKI